MNEGINKGSDLVLRQVSKVGRSSRQGLRGDKVKTRTVWFATGTVVGSAGVLYGLWRFFLWTLVKVMDNEYAAKATREAIADVGTETIERLIYPNGMTSHRRRGPVWHQGYTTERRGNAS